MEENGQEAKSRKKVRPLIVIGLLLLSMWLLFFLFFLWGGFKSTRWESREFQDENEKKRVAAEELLMPEIADYLDRISERGLRDTEYVYETIWFASVEDLFEALPYEKEDNREVAIEDLPLFLLEKENFHDFETLLSVPVKIYEIPSGYLPLDRSDGKRTNDVEYGCFYFYYIVVDEANNNRAKLLCLKMQT